MTLAVSLCVWTAFAQNDSVARRKWKEHMDVYRYNISEIVGFRWSKIIPGCHVLGPFVVDGAKCFAYGTDDDSIRLERYMREEPTSAEIVREFGHRAVANALNQGSWELAVRLIERGADPNPRDDLGQTPLFWIRTPEYAEYLLGHGADPNARDSSGCPVLHYVLDLCRHKIGAAIVNAGADVNATYRGWTALDLARLCNEPELVETIRRHGGIETGRGAIADAIIREDEAEVARLLKRDGSLASITHPDGRTPLHVAALLPGSKIAEILLRHGTPVDARDDDGETPLHWAARTGNVPLVELLLRHGADPNARDSTTHGTPLWETRDYRNELNIIRYAVALDDPTSARNDNLEQTLIQRAERNRRTVVNRLLRHGANVRLTTGNGETPLHQAVRMESDPAIVRMFLSHGADVNARDADGNTPLHNAVEEGTAGMVRWLLGHGADPNARNVEGRTPLYALVWRGEVDDDPKRMTILNLLLRSGADPDIPDNDGQTPISLAEGNEIVTKMLTKR